jgi:hypothetical protein
VIIFRILPGDPFCVGKITGFSQKKISRVEFFLEKILERKIQRKFPGFPEKFQHPLTP